MAKRKWLLDAGLFVGAFYAGDPRFVNARKIVDLARQGAFEAYTTLGIISETYAALTWSRAPSPLNPQQAAELIKLLLLKPSRLQLLSANPNAASIMLQIAKEHGLTARRIHDARHAAIALTSGVADVLSYDLGDWTLFEKSGLKIHDPKVFVQSL